MAGRHGNRELIPFARHDRHRVKGVPVKYIGVRASARIAVRTRKTFKCVIKAEGAYRVIVCKIVLPGKASRLRRNGNAGIEYVCAGNARSNSTERP